MTDKHRYFKNGMQAGSDSAIRAILQMIVSRPRVDYDLIDQIRKMQENTFFVSGEENGQTASSPTHASHSIGNESCPDSNHGADE